MTNTSSHPPSSSVNQTPELVAAHRQMAIIRDQKRSVERQLTAAAEHNKKLRAALESARTHIETLKKAVAHDLALPQHVGTLIRALPKTQTPQTEHTAEIMVSGRLLHCAVSPLIAPNSLEAGRQVLLDEHSVVTAVLPYEPTGELVTVREILDGQRIIAVGRSDEEHVLRLSEALRQDPPQPGETVTIDHRTGFALEKIKRTGIEELVLEDVPNIQYHDIGGLGAEIEAIKDAVELPFIHPHLYRQHKLTPPKGILLYGPPGNGKTMIAKAVARSLAQRAAEKSGHPHAKGYFLNIKGPELLNKYVGETERQIRNIFSRAREKANSGIPVVIFFDEMESLFRTRGSGVSSDVETTIVPQLLTEIDGVEKLDNVIIIGATNREDMIDPAVLRPGRLDVKIRIDRPNAQSAREIFALYLTPDLPLQQEEIASAGSRESAINTLIETGVDAIYSRTRHTQYVEITYTHGEKETLWFSDFVSGAVIRNIVDRAKKYAIKDLLTHQTRGISTQHIRYAVAQEFTEQQELPDTSAPDEWAKITGHRSNSIAEIKIVDPDTWMHSNPQTFSRNSS